MPTVTDPRSTSPLATPTPRRLIAVGLVFGLGLVFSALLTSADGIARYRVQAAWAALVWGGWVLLGVSSGQPQIAPRARLPGALGIALAAVVVTLVLNWASGYIFGAP
ncbi:MAG: hypothetical protein ACXWZS_03295 [Gemmatirosa sp.]